MSDAMLVSSSEAALEAYQGLAPVYDTMKSGNNNAKWVRLLDRIINQWEAPGNRLLDVGCGTGQTSTALADLGYAVTGCDISPEMIAQAEARGRRDVSFFTADMQQLPGGLGTFDVVTCLDDALNYLLDADALAAALHQITGVLAPRGVLLFDLNTLNAYRTIGASTHVVTDTERLFMVLEGRGKNDQESGEQIVLEFTGFEDRGDAGWRRFSSRHLQRHHPTLEVYGLLTDARLTPLHVYGFNDGALHQVFDEQSADKALFVARRL